MSQDTFDLFLNPMAGRGRAGGRISRLIALFAAAGIAVRVHESRGSGDLEQQVRTFVEGGGARLLVAGGDGTIHEAVNGIMQANGEAELGIVPNGTGNDFAKAAFIPLDWQQAARELAGRINNEVPARRVDIGTMNERYFANGAGIGFDARVNQVAQAYRWKIGDLVYLLAVFRTMFDGIATPDFTISTGDGERTGPVTLVNVSNGPWVGGMFHIAPQARNDDGWLDLVVADPVSRRRILALLPKLLRGRHMDEPEVSHSRLLSLRVESAEPVPSHLDGESQPEQTVFEIGLLPAALRLL